MDLRIHQQKAKDSKAANKKLVAALKKRKPKDLDAKVLELHEEAFDEIDCLECANCCKTISPIITDKDIQRIAKHLKMKPSYFTVSYLELDMEDDYIFKSQPCPFLGADNYCSIYEVRPKACADYPHTDRKKFHQLLDLSLKNTMVCPAVERIFTNLRIDYL